MNNWRKSYLGESSNETGFADPGIAHNDHFEKEFVIFHLINLRQH